LCFLSDKFLENNTEIVIDIPIINLEYKIKAVVAWCEKIENSYKIGVQFLDTTTKFRMRMVEQVCYIEHYKKEVLTNEGRELSNKEAAFEWISKYGKDFPK